MRMQIELTRTAWAKRNGGGNSADHDGGDTGDDK